QKNTWQFRNHLFQSFREANLVDEVPHHHPAAIETNFAHAARPIGRHIHDLTYPPTIKRRRRIKVLLLQDLFVLSILQVKTTNGSPVRKPTFRSQCFPLCQLLDVSRNWSWFLKSPFVEDKKRSLTATVSVPLILQYVVCSDGAV